MFQQTIKMSSYKQKWCRHTQKKDVPSQPKKPNYKPSSFYQYENIGRRKWTLKINARNNKDSFNVTLHKTK